jgi:hypothetical protein
MKKLYVLLILACVPALVFFGCKHDPVLPEQQVSFSGDIQPILQMGCMHSGCHSDSANAEFPLTDYESVMENGDVKAGEPLDSDLYEVLVEEDAEDRMPKDRPPLSDRNIKLIYIWIAQGAQNN